MYYKKYGIIPFGERAHNEEGIVEFYKEHFEMNDIYAILKMLLLINDNKIERNSYCICNSGRKIKNCHYSKMYELKDINLKSDIVNVAKYIEKLEEQKNIERKLNIQKRLYIEKIRKYPYNSEFFRNKMNDLFLKK